MYYAVVGIVSFATLAMTAREGIWSNTVTLINIIFSGLIAFGLYAPLTSFVDGLLGGQFTYVLDFLMIWTLFVVTMLITRLCTDRLSRTKLRLKYPLDTIGGPLVGLLTAYVMTSLLAATLHTAPLTHDTMGGKLVYPPTSGKLPGIAWLSFVERVSEPDGLGSGGGATFNADKFAETYFDHRKKLDAAPGLKVQR